MGRNNTVSPSRRVFLENCAKTFDFRFEELLKSQPKELPVGCESGVSFYEDKFYKLFQEKQKEYTKEITAKLDLTLTDSERITLEWFIENEFKAAIRKYANDIYLEYKNNLHEVFTLKPGEYFIGDFCYFISDTLEECVFDEELNRAKHIPYELCFFAELQPSPFKEPHILGQIITFNTFYGDGVFVGSNGFGYGVDSGTIGAVAKELCDAEDVNVIDGTLLKSDKPIKVTYTKSKITFELEDGDDLTIYLED